MSGCPICYRTISLEDEAYVGTCYHRFCVGCIREWTEAQRRHPSVDGTGPAYTCPMCKRPYEYILYDCVLKSFRTEYVDEAAERRARAAAGGPPGGSAFALSAAHRRRRALYVSQGSAPEEAGGATAPGASAGVGSGGVGGATARAVGAGSAGLAPPAAAPVGRAAVGAGCRAAAAASVPGTGAIRRGADDPELQAFVRRELQAVLLQEDVALVAQHVLGVMRSVMRAAAPGSSSGAGGRGAKPGLALAPGRNKYVPQPKRPRTGVAAAAASQTVQEVEAAVCREAACFLQADAQEFARQVGLFLTSGLSVKAYDGFVFGSTDGHAAPQDREEGGPADAGSSGGDAGGSASSGRGAGVPGQKRKSSCDVIDLIESDTDGDGDDFGYQEYSGDD